VLTAGPDVCTRPSPRREASANEVSNRDTSLPTAPHHPPRSRSASGSVRPERGVTRTGTRLRVAARSLTGPPRRRRIAGEPALGVALGPPRPGPAAGEAGGGTSAPPTEVALIVPMRPGVADEARARFKRRPFRRIATRIDGPKGDRGRTPGSRLRMFFEHGATVLEAFTYLRKSRSSDALS
jgi:hypothetical protein